MLIQVIDAINDAIGGTLVKSVGTKTLGKHGRPPRIVWVPIGSGRVGPGSIGGNPPALSNRAVRCVVHCWGKDILEAERLEQVLETAARDVLDGANYEIGNSDYTQPEWCAQGFVISVAIEIHMPSVRAKLPYSAADDTYPTVVITSTEIDATGAVAGDGTLQAGES